MVDVSNLKINVADANELQQLKFIGPKRAAGIITFRQTAGQIPDAKTLAAATGMSLKQCETLAASIDFSLTDQQPIGLSFALPVFFVTLILLAGVGLSQLFIQEAQRPLEIIFNGSLLFIILACICTVISGILQKVSFETEDHKINDILLPLISLVTITLSLSGSGLMFCVLTLSAFVPSTTAFHAQIQLVWQYLCYLVIIFIVLYGPQAHLQLLGPRLTQRGLNISSFAYDLLQPVLLLLLIVMQWLVNSPTLLEELFGAWACVSFGLIGLELARGSSAYLQGLSPADRRIVTYNISLRTNKEQTKGPSESRWRLLMGLIVLLEVFLLLLAIVLSN